MRRLLISGTAALLLNLLGTPAAAQVSVHINIPLPPPIVFAAPPDVVVVPETEVYVVPDAPEDIFFYSGWWWRPWEGRWYRSRYYNRGWAHYRSVPSFYGRVPHGWRDDYREHRWGGGAWNHEPIHHDDLRRHWRGWHQTRHWEQPQYRQHQMRHDGRSYDRPTNMERRHEPNRPEVNRRDAVRHEDINRNRPGRENRDPGRGTHERGRVDNGPNRMSPGRPGAGPGNANPARPPSVRPGNANPGRPQGNANPGRPQGHGNAPEDRRRDRP